MLIVDDDRDLVDLHAFWLADDYTVVTAYDGVEALSLLDHDIDVVLLDRRMPRRNGNEVLGHIRASNITCMVALVSAVEPPEDVLEIGYDGFIRKPTNSEQLRDLVDRLIRRSAFNERLREYFGIISTIAGVDPGLLERDDRSRFDTLLGRKIELREELDRFWTTFDDTDYEMLLRSLGRGETTGFAHPNRASRSTHYPPIQH